MPDLPTYVSLDYWRDRAKKTEADLATIHGAYSDLAKLIKKANTGVIGNCEALSALIAERDRLRERVGPIMVYLTMIVAAYDTDPNDPLSDDTEISSFCASGASGKLTVGMVRKALKDKS